MARMAKNNDALVDAINRMAEAQEKANIEMAKMNELHRQGFELNMKQYSLNIDNYKYNLEQAEKAEAATEDHFAALNNGIRQYVDESYNKLWGMIQQQVSLLLSSHHDLEKKLDKKADQEAVAQSIAQRMMKSIKGKGTI